MALLDVLPLNDNNSWINIARRAYRFVEKQVETRCAYENNSSVNSSCNKVNKEVHPESSQRVS